MFRTRYLISLAMKLELMALKKSSTFLDSTPAISSINKHLTLKYESDNDLIDLLKIKTKIK